MSAAEPSPELVVRPMTAADLNAVERIEQESFTAPWSRRSFKALLGREDADLWTAEVDGGVAGYAVVWYVLSEAELGNLAVAPGYRRCGIGSRLLDSAVARARERGVQRIFLEVRVSNDVARTLYERRGFIQVGIRRRYYHSPVEDARVLCLEVGSGG